MKALVYSGWDRLEIADVETPIPGDDEVLLSVAACGICGSELESFGTRSPRRTPPVIMGHEFCGTVASVGKAVRRFKDGDRLISNSVVPCLSCSACRRGDNHLCSQRQIFGMHRLGAFAEFVTVPEHCLIDWPDGMPASRACLAEPLANGIHVRNITNHLKVRSLLIIGAGPIGLMCQQAEQVFGDAAVHVSDLREERRSIASTLGAASVVDPKTVDVVEHIKQLTNGEGVDLVIDAVGSEASKRQSLEAARPGGSVVWIGLHGNQVRLDTYDITLSERTVFGSYAAGLTELEQAVELIAAGDVDVSSWVETYPLADGVEAFTRLLARDCTTVKSVLTP